MDNGSKDTNNNYINNRNDNFNTNYDINFNIIICNNDNYNLYIDDTNKLFFLINYFSLAGTALTSISNLSRVIKPIKSSRVNTQFDFDVTDLPLLRDIDRRVDLNDVIGLEYLSSGSNSQIYSAVWQGQRVIVKVRITATLSYLKLLSKVIIDYFPRPFYCLHNTQYSYFI